MAVDEGPFGRSQAAANTLEHITEVLCHRHLLHALSFGKFWQDGPLNIQKISPQYITFQILANFLKQTKFLKFQATITTTTNIEIQQINSKIVYGKTNLERTTTTTTKGQEKDRKCNSKTRQ